MEHNVRGIVRNLIVTSYKSLSNTRRTSELALCYFVFNNGICHPRVVKVQSCQLSENYSEIDM